jgi:RpiB/LacA/LacB family sugar-phosphate isomerase
MHNLIIPLAGMGSRFLKQGFKIPKHLIFAETKQCIDWSMESIEINDFNIIFILREDQINNFQYDEILKNKYGKNIKIVKVKELTRGAVESCLSAKKYINNDYPLSIFTVDVAFEPKYSKKIIPKNCDGFLLTFNANSINYSYAKINRDGFVEKTEEKKIISNDALVGIYNFKHGKTFVKFAEQMINNNILSNNEFYIAPMYNLLIKNNLKIKSKKVDKMHLFGTPEELEFFIHNSIRTFNKKTIGLCSDHSGFKLKNEFKNFLDKKKIKHIDFGCYTSQPCDYDDYVKIACNSYIEKNIDSVFSFCRSGQGVNISANKNYKKIISSLVYNLKSLELSIKHNCSNFFSFPSFLWKKKDFNKILKIYLNSSFDGGRHQNRISKIFD